MRVRLTRKNGTEQRIIEGDATFPPIVGQPFRVVRDDDTRMTTTDVSRDRGDGLFETISGGLWHVELVGPEALAIARRYESA